MYDDDCNCVARCRHCRLPSILVPSSSSDEALCHLPGYTPPAELAWTALAGLCRLSDGSRGHPAVSTLPPRECEAACARAAACKAYETHDGRCELHAILPTQAAPQAGAACMLKTLPPTQP